MMDETIQQKFRRWTDERPFFLLSEFHAQTGGSTGFDELKEMIIPLLPGCGCEALRRGDDYAIQWLQSPACLPHYPESGFERLPEDIEDRILEYISRKTGKPWDDPVTLERIREAVKSQKETYWQEGDDRAIRYGSGYSVFAYLAYHLPVYFIQMRHLLSELLVDRLLPGRMAVLDVGAGPGTVTLALTDLLSGMPECRATIHAIEQSGEFIEAYNAITRSYTEGSGSVTAPAPYAADISDPASPLPDGPYDLIVCANVLNEISDATAREEAVMRLAERLREDGTLLICEPADLANATALRNLSRRLKGRGLSIYSPCNDIRGVPCMVERCWTFTTFPEIRSNRLMVAVAKTPEKYRYLNTDIKVSYAIHRKDGKKKSSYRVAPGVKAERLSRLQLHEGKRINLIASKISGNIGDKETFLYRICDGTGKREVYAALPIYHQSERNLALRSAGYGSVLRFDQILVRYHKKYDAFHLLLTKDSTITLIDGTLKEADQIQVSEEKQKKKQGSVKGRRDGKKPDVGKRKKK